MNGSPATTGEGAETDVRFVRDDSLRGTFEPQEDITAYELAILLPAIFRGMSRAEYDNLGHMQRHIRLAS